MSDCAYNICEFAGFFRFFHVLEEAFQGWILVLVHEETLEFSGKRWFSFKLGLLFKIGGKRSLFLIGFCWKGLDLDLLYAIIILTQCEVGVILWGVGGAVSVLHIEVWVFPWPPLFETSMEVENIISIICTFDKVSVPLTLINKDIIILVLIDCVEWVVLDWITVLSYFYETISPLIECVFKVCVVVIVIAPVV